MREYINKLARGSFLYKIPDLKVSIAAIDEKVTQDRENTYEFTVSAQTPVKGVVYSSNENIIVEDLAFQGVNNTIRYHVNAKEINPGEVITGSFDLVSSSGEIQIPYCFQVVENALETSSGNVIDLLHFANLVQSSPEEACRLFGSDRFQKVLLEGSLELENLYEVIKNEKNTLEAIEEFMVAARKKNPVEFHIADTKKTYTDLNESIQESLGITKSSWGYLQLGVHVDADFIRPACNEITSADFTGNRYELEFLVDRKKMHAGKNYADITISSFNQSLVCHIEVNNSGNATNIRETKAAFEKLTIEYLKFRMKNTDLAAWVENSNRILDRVRGVDQENVYFRLVQAQIYLAQKRSEEGIWLLENIREGICSSISRRDKLQEDVELYCYFLYVDSLAVQKPEYTEKVTGIVTEYYENGYDTWRVLWILFYLDASNEKNKSIKLTRIKDTYHNGCTSPVMYFEALTIMNAQPSLVRVLNDFELQVISFGCKYKMLSKNLVSQVTGLIGNVKVASTRYLKVLNKLYSLYETDEILTVLVIHMIRNELTGTTYFELYEKGILRGLRITRLFEFYMVSMEKREMRKLPKMVLMYFSYESQLPYAIRAYLYANVIFNEKENAEIFSLYERQIERFGYEQMRLGHIDDNLAVIYRHIWEDQMLNEDTSEFMSRFAFTYKVTCFEDNIKSVIVKHKELSGQTSYLVIDKVAYVQMYTDNCAVAFEDENGIRRKESIRYEIEKVFEDNRLLEAICLQNQQDVYIQLYMHELSQKTRVAHDEMVENCRALFKNENINEKFKNELNSWLIHYYDESDIKEDFRQRFVEIDRKNLAVKDAVCLAEACIENKLYEDAFDLVCEYGYEKMAPVKLLKLLRHMISLYDFAEDKRLTQLCSYVFLNKKYDEEVLQYMAMYFNGTNDQMYLVWKACNNFKVNSRELAERIIVQMLFTGEHSGRLTEVFGTYYNAGIENVITDGYIAYNAYLYFVKQRKANDIVFKAIEKRITDEQDIPEVCRLALLKHYAEHVQKEWFQEKRELAQKILNEMCKAEKLFEFYRKFAGVLDIPYNMADKTVLEYRADPSHKVEIHYVLTNDGESEKYVTETMKCLVGGVFTKSFMLFFGDSIQYYFTEEGGKDTVKTDNYSLLCNNVNPEQTDGRFDYINDMLSSKELHDMVTMKKLMYGYSVGNYIGQQLFKPMD